MSHRILWVMLAVVLAVLLAAVLVACGGGAETEEPTPTAMPTPATVSTPTQIPTAAPTHIPTPTTAPTQTRQTPGQESSAADDHSDDSGDATVIGVGEFIQGSINGLDDIDWFVFQAEGERLYRIDFTLGTAQNAWVYILDGEWFSGRGYHTQGTADDPELFAFTFSDDKEYIKVEASASSGAYAMTLQEVADVHGDDVDNATTISVGETIEGYGNNRDDNDFFVFEAAQGQIYTIDATRVDSPILVSDDIRERVNIYLGDGEWLHGDWAPIRWRPPLSGPYYVEVREPTIGSYTLTVTSSGTAVTPTPTPVATPSPAPTAIPTPETVTSSTTSLMDEYLAQLDCASFESVEEPETNGDLSDFYSGIIDRMSTLSPPAEIVEWHGLILSTTVEAKAILDALPKDDAIDLTDLLEVIELFESANVREAEIVSRLPDDVRQQMAEAGCVDDVGVETQPEPTPTPAPPAATPTPVAAEDDHGNDTGSATAVSVEDTTAGVIDYEFDDDYFRFTAEEGVIYQIDVALGTLDDSTLDVVDALEWVMAFNDDFGDSYASRVIWTPAESGDYYAVVGGFGTGSYTLTIAESNIVDDHGGGTNTATAVSLGADIGGAVEYDGDADYFRFTTEAGVIYQIDVALGTLGDSYAALRDSDDWELAYSDDFGDSLASRIVWGAPESGDYYVEVGGYDTGSYTLTIAVSDIVDDHSNDFRLATIVSVGDETPGAIDYEGDEDFFRFTAEAGVSYQIDVTLGTLADSVLDLTDSNSAQLAYNDDFGDSYASRIVWEAPASGNYYLMVSAWSGAGSYTLTISEQ